MEFDRDIAEVKYLCAAASVADVNQSTGFTDFRCENPTKHQNRRLSDLTTFVRLSRLWQNGAKLSHCMKTRLFNVRFEPRGIIIL